MKLVHERDTPIFDQFFSLERGDNRKCDCHPRRNARRRCNEPAGVLIKSPAYAAETAFCWGCYEEIKEPDWPEWDELRKPKN